MENNAFYLSSYYTLDILCYKAMISQTESDFGRQNEIKAVATDRALEKKSRTARVDSELCAKC